MPAWWNPRRAATLLNLGVKFNLKIAVMEGWHCEPSKILDPHHLQRQQAQCIASPGIKPSRPGGHPTRTMMNLAPGILLPGISLFSNNSSASRYIILVCLRCLSIPSFPAAAPISGPSTETNLYTCQALLPIAVSFRPNYRPTQVRYALCV